jgi:hypothetical protein
LPAGQFRRLAVAIDATNLIHTNVYVNTRKIGIKKRFFMAFCITIILIGGGLALLSNARLNTPTHAAPGLPNSDLSVVGSPSLPASTVDSIFARLGSPLVGTGALVEQTSRQTNIDDAFALAVWWTETNDGAAGVGLADRNPGSVRGSVGYPSAYDGYTIYPSYAAAIVYWFHMLKNRYVGRGLNTVYAISHPYVGTSSSYLWAGKVVALMLRYRGEAPPTVTPDPTALAQSRHIARFAASGAAGKITAQHAVSVLAQKQSSALSTTTTWLIAVLALLLALAIALCVQVLPTGSPTRDGVAPRFAFQSPISRLPSRSLDAPHTDALGAQFATPRATPGTTPLTTPTTGRLRRTLLLPALPTSDLPAQDRTTSTGVRTTGLLTRYRNTVPVHQSESGL